MHYYDKNSRQELDFIIEEKNKITILEVKSGEKFLRHASLDTALREHSEHIHRAVVLCRGNVSLKDDILYLPLYMAIFL